jgi:class 3 adenylate cyclase
MLVVVTLTSSLVIGLLGWTNGRRALEQTITNQMTSIRAAQTYQIESYFDQVFSHTRTLSQDRMMVNAMKQFRAGYEIGLYRPLADAQTEAVAKFYDTSFGEAIATKFKDPPLPFMFRPKRAVSNYFQYHYIVENSFPSGKKDSLIEANGDNTIYNRFHKFYHPLFRDLMREFDYYDVFLIDIKSLAIIYSVYKEIDFATSLIDGPHQDSGLGLLAKQIRDKPQSGEVKVVDFRSYIPSYGAPAAFVGAPIYDGNKAVGILAIQLPAREINRAMTYGQNWAENGLGETGESYIVGEDRTMRSDARQLIEGKDDFIDLLKDSGLTPSTVANIANFETTNTVLPAVSESVDRAFAGEAGTHLSRNYLGEPVLSSFAPLQIPGLNWVIVSEMAAAEAFRPITEMQRNILVWGVVLVLIAALLSMLLSRLFVRPIEKLADGVARLGQGDDNFQIVIDSRDEFGELATNFNKMVASIREKSNAVELKDQENDRLLLNILPPSVAQRIKSGERVNDQLQQVSVAYLHIAGFSDMSHGANATKSAEYLTALIAQFDDLSQNFDVERIKTVGNTYIAGCGLTHARLDHSSQMVDFAIAAHKAITQFNANNTTQLALQIGIDAGPVVAAVVGEREYHYQVWGKAVNIAERAHILAQPGSILVTDSVRQKIDDDYGFAPSETAVYNGDKIQLHSLKLRARS